MMTRREFLQAAVAAGAVMPALAGGGWMRAAAQQALSEADLLAFQPKGNVTLVHIADIHAQLMPVYFREPSVNLGVGEVVGKPPHLTGKDFLEFYKIKPGTPEAYALTAVDFEALAKSYGKMGGLDRVAHILKSIRAERGDKTLFLDCGDTWQGSYTALQTKGQDMVDAMNALKPDAMTGHWEFTLGADRVKEIVDGLPFPFLAGNVVDTEWEEPVFKATAMFERGGVKIGVVGQAFPYTPIANPRWMFPKWSFGIREQTVQTHVDAVRAEGAQLVVLLSHNGFDVDRKMASRVKGIDVILSSHTHDAIPEPLLLGKTLLVSSGSSGKFVSRLDLDVGSDGVKGYSYRLIPVFSDVVKPDPEMAALIAKIRAPHEAEMKRVLGTAGSLLYRRGNFNGTFDDLICQALLEQQDAEIALSPGFRWGVSVLPGQPITVEDLYTQTGMTYPAVYRLNFTGERLKEVMEDVADNLFHPDPYKQQGGDMVRIGGMGYSIDINKPMGSRISDMTHLKTGQPIDPKKEYAVAGWASVNPDTKGPPVWEVVEKHLAANRNVTVPPNDSVKIKT